MPGFELIGDAEREHVNQVLDNGIFFRYEFEKERKGIYKVRDFETEFAKFIGTRHAQAVTSGSSALKVALVSLGVKPGDEVITQSFTFIATFEAIIECGAVPVPTEIDETLNMDPADLVKKITPKTKVVIPVHMLGGPARILQIKEIASKNGLKVLEDTAQALGASVDSKLTGSIGNCGTFSFDFYKTITTGEGGMITTDDPELYKTASEYADHGHDHNPNVGRALEGRRFLGFNYRMNEFQGAIGLAQLGRIDRILDVQKTNHTIISEALSVINGVTMRSLPEKGRDSYTHVCFFLPDGKTTTEFHKKVTERGISAISFKNNLWHFLGNWEHLIGQKTAWPGGFPFSEPYYDGKIAYNASSLPATTGLLERLIVVPVSLRTSENDAKRIASGLSEAAKEII
ncbi:MAG: DegT/DnrJ/EryC1/StrS family aminotransferase [Desulfomonilaceae bacterium]